MLNEREERRRAQIYADAVHEAGWRDRLHEQVSEQRRRDQERWDYYERKEAEEYHAQQAEAARRAAMSPAERAAEVAEAARRAQAERDREIDRSAREYHEYWRNPHYRTHTVSYWSAGLAALLTPRLVGLGWPFEPPLGAAMACAVVAGVLVGVVVHIATRYRVDATGKDASARFGRRYNRDNYDPDRPSGRRNRRALPDIAR